ncbi:MAG: hypothetical protein HY067_01605 [Betaproteobacteria bacterium]|nr:hypothetical protein [Betaproteobacteria bacterium]
MNSAASIQELLEPLFPGLMGVQLSEVTANRVMVWQTKITSEEGKLCAVVTQTQLVLDA